MTTDGYVRLIDTAHHESQHLTVATVLQLRVHSANLDHEPGQTGVVTVYSPRNYEEALRTLSYILAPIARDHPLPVDEGPHDAGNATALYKHWQMRLDDWLFACATARHVLSENNELLCSFADALERRRTLDADDIARIVQENA